MRQYIEMYPYWLRQSLDIQHYFKEKTIKNYYFKQKSVAFERVEFDLFAYKICLISINVYRVSSSATRSRSGSSQSSLHSQWLSKNVSTSAMAASAPRTRDRTKPSRFSFRMTRTLLIFANSKPSSAMEKKTQRKKNIQMKNWIKMSQI